MKTEYDVVIVGGGMVGASLALCLSQQLGVNTRILLVESFPLPENTGELGINDSPSFDARSTALSHSSRIIYETLGLWPLLSQRLCEIETIHVSDQGRIGSVLLEAKDSGLDALGYVVENAWLGQILIQQLRAEQRIELLSPATVLSVKPKVGGVDLELSLGKNTRQLSAGLMVVADGAHSGLRDQLGIGTRTRDYKQSALIANISFEKSHGYCAFERFMSTGPMAVLPLLDAANGSHRAALVWTLPRDQVDQLQRCSELEFVKVLQKQFGYRLGALARVGKRHCYPLSLIEAKEQVRSHLVVMGNAAHSLHPVAGQGFNLALRDIAHLSAVLSQAEQSDRPLGSLEVLLGYESKQRRDQKLTIGFSDKVIEVFAHSNPIVGFARTLGLLAVDLVPELKKQFVYHAAGEAGLGNWTND